jgi:translation elongation factor EF-1beta
MKKICWSVFTALVGFVFLVAAGGCRPNETVERQVDDAGIKTSVKAKLASDVRFSTLTAVSVDVTNGVVTLAGPVHSEDEKQKIEETVRSVKGVVNVTNALQVQAEAAPPPAGATPVSVQTPPPTPIPTPSVTPSA